MLREVPDTTRPGEPGRRWFAGAALELIVWEDDSGVRSFQLRHGHQDRDRVLEWRRGSGLAAFELDDGEERGGRAKAAPVLRPADPPDLEGVRERFLDEASALPDPIRRAVLTALGGPA